MPVKYLYAPWQAPKEVLEQHKIIIGKTYPYPIINYKQSREDALKALNKMRKQFTEN